MTRKTAIALIAALLMPLAAWAIPDSLLPDPEPGAPLVVDYAGILSTRERMNDSLLAFEQAHDGAQILVVTVTDLKGFSANEFATGIGNKWGIGQRGKDNGVVMLVKPKLGDSDKGHLFIAPGRSLEGVLPDLRCHHITELVMLPIIREGGSYDDAVWAGLEKVTKLVAGEKVEVPGDNDGNASLLFGGGIVAGFVLLWVVCYRRMRKRGVTLTGPQDKSNPWTKVYHGSSRGSGGGGHSYGGGSFSGGGGGSSW